MLLVSARTPSASVPRARNRPWRPALTLVAALVAALVAVLVAAGPASAHTDLLQASPGPGQQTGGTVDFVDLAFLDRVSDVAISVTHGGQPVPGTVTVPDGQIIRFVFDQPLSDPGRYDVTYLRTSSDFDRTAETYFFTYEPASPQAFHLGQVSPPAAASGSGRNWIEIGALAVLVVALAGLGFLYLTRVESRRAGSRTSPEVDGRDVAATGDADDGAPTSPGEPSRGR